jgi:hypothetical protein
MNDAARDGTYDVGQSGFITVAPGEVFTFSSSNPVAGANGSVVYHQGGSGTNTELFGLPGTYTYTVPSGETFVQFIWYATKNGVRQTGKMATWAVSCTPAP